LPRLDDEVEGSSSDSAIGMASKYWSRLETSLSHPSGLGRGMANRAMKNMTPRAAITPLA
jgi:hypothetical protein